MKSLVRIALISAAAQWAWTPTFAQPVEPILDGRGMVWGSLGFQGDLGGAVNTSGIGVVSGLRAEIDANTWAERYDTALVFRIGGAYNLTSNSQVFAALTWEQSEADTTTVGLIGGQPLQAKFSDYQGTSIDAGYRYFFNTETVGFERINDAGNRWTLPIMGGVYLKF